MEEYPRTRESCGVGFVTMATNKEADRCIKYLDRSVLEGRVIMVEKARRRRGRTPTPGSASSITKLFRSKLFSVFKEQESIVLLFFS